VDVNAPFDICSPYPNLAMVPRSGDGEVEASHLPGVCREDLEGLADIVLSFGGRLYLAHTQVLAMSSKHLASLVALQREAGREGRCPHLSLLPNSEPSTVPEGVREATSEEFSSFLRLLYRSEVAFQVRPAAAGAPRPLCLQPPCCPCCCCASACQEP
jgi:hypothetical protein